MNFALVDLNKNKKREISMIENRKKLKKKKQILTVGKFKVTIQKSNEERERESFLYFFINFN